jgi:hypothetical protein
MTWCSSCLAMWEAKRLEPTTQAKWLARFDSKIDKESRPCWQWTAAKSSNGYGSFGVEGKSCHAHRLSYERYKGPIPAGFDIDHICRNRACVNPDHLEAVSRKDNVQRGARGALKTHCAQGHPWTDEHIYVRPANGKRMCRTCNVERSRARYSASKGERTSQASAFGTAANLDPIPTEDRIDFADERRAKNGDGNEYGRCSCSQDL